MAQTMAQLRKETYKILNEANNTTVGALGDGTGGVVASYDSDSTINMFIAEGVAELCRSCVAYPVTGSLSFSSGIRTGLIQSVTSPSPANATLWFPTDVLIGSTLLTHTGESSLRANDLSYASSTTASSANVTHWYRQDNFAISLYPYVVGATTSVTVRGYGIPDCTLSDATSFDFIPDDLLRQALPAFAATKVIMKNIDDPTLANRMFWKSWYDNVRMKLYMQLDSGLKRPGGPFAIPPVVAQQ